MKKIYIRPQSKTVKIECQHILAGSVTGTDVSDTNADGNKPVLVGRDDRTEMVDLDDGDAGNGIQPLW